MKNFDEDRKASNDNLAQFRCSKDDEKDARKSRKKEQEEVRRCLALVKECGVTTNQMNSTLLPNCSRMIIIGRSSLSLKMKSPD